MSELTYTFDGSLVRAIKKQRKTATVRYDDDRRLVPGDLFLCQTPDGDPFARCTAEAVVSTRICHAPSVIRGLGADHAATDADQLLDQLRAYYPAEIGRKTPVRVITFQMEATR